MYRDKLIPSQIIKKEYEGARNFMTPTVLKYGALPGGAYELSSGTGIMGEPIFGLSVVRLFEDNSTRRYSSLSCCFDSLDYAKYRVEVLKKAIKIFGWDDAVNHLEEAELLLEKYLDSQRS